MPRRYELKKRAERQEETRRRIVEATVALHGTVGPAQTTITAIAQRAGVERLTVYRHFPDEAALLRACSSHWVASQPPLDPAAWQGVAEPEDRLRAALTVLYDYYAHGEAVIASVRRDLPVSVLVQETLRPFQQFLASIGADLAAAQRAPKRRRPLVAAAVGHALEFTTWRSLVREQGLRTEDAIELMVGLARDARGGP